jgi:hypothetical protein
MGLLLLEALAVLGIAIFIVWWTMFSGRRQGAAVAPAVDEPRDAAGPGGKEVDEPEGGSAARGQGGPTGTAPTVTKPGAD